MPAPELQKVAGDATIPKSVDVVVVGGGIIGASAALFLAERNVSVALCEKGEIAGEQSSRNWGWVRQMGRDPAELPLSIHSREVWRKLNDMTGRDTGYRETGILYVCTKKREIAEHEAWLEHARTHGVASKLLSRREIAEIVPGAQREFLGGLFTSTDARAEPGAATPAIAEAARNRGAAILTGCAVRGIETRGGGVSAVVTEHGRISCAQVILAGGAWSRLFAGNVGVDFPQLKIIGSAARIENVTAPVDFPVGGANFSFRRRLDGGYTIAMRNANIAPIVPDSFRLFSDFAPALVRQWHELRLRIGNRFLEEWRTPRRWHLDEITPFERVRTLDPVPSPSLNRQGLRNLISSFPAFKGARVTHDWSGLIDVTPDAVPAIGPLEALPGLYLASGFSGHGFGIGPGAGQLIAEIACGDRPCVDPSPFRPERFERNGLARAHETGKPSRRAERVED